MYIKKIFPALLPEVRFFAMFVYLNLLGMANHNRLTLLYFLLNVFGF